MLGYELLVDIAVHLAVQKVLEVFPKRNPWPFILWEILAVTSIGSGAFVFGFWV